MTWSLIGDSFGTQVMQHVIAHVRRNKSWNVIQRHVLDDRPVTGIDKKAVDGIISCASLTRHIEPLRSLGKPVVNAGVGKPFDRISSVSTCNESVGRMAAEYLIGHGLRQFACVGVLKSKYSVERWNGFNALLRTHGMEPARFFNFQYDAIGNLIEDAVSFANEPFDHWLIKLPLPCGIFCVADEIGHLVADACRLRRLNVPQDVALLGVNNNAALCNAAYPPLSSIEQPLDLIAQKAVDLLSSHMANKRLKPQAIRFDPLRVVTRQSTDTLAVEDHWVRQALHYMRMNADRVLSIEEVLVAVPVSRRKLERRFKNALGSTLRKEIHRARIQHVKQLLLETDLTIDEISGRCGFPSGGNLSRLFKKITGYPPSVLRRT